MEQWPVSALFFLSNDYWHDSWYFGYIFLSGSDFVSVKLNSSWFQGNWLVWFFHSLFACFPLGFESVKSTRFVQVGLLLHLLAVIVYMNALEVICFGKYQNNTIMDFFSLWLPSYAVSHMNWIHLLRTIFLRFSLRIIAGFEDQSLTISSQRTHPYWWEINLQKFPPYLFSFYSFSVTFCSIGH